MRLWNVDGNEARFEGNLIYGHNMASDLPTGTVVNTMKLYLEGVSGGWQGLLVENGVWKAETNIGIISVESDLQYICTNNAHDISVAVLPNPLQYTNIQAEIVGDAVFVADAGETNLISIAGSTNSSFTNVTIKGITPSFSTNSDVIGYTFNGMECVKDHFAVGGVDALTLIDPANISNSVTDTTDYNEPPTGTNTLYFLDTNGTVSIDVSLAWLPTNAPGSMFKWKIEDMQGYVVATGSFETASTIHESWALSDPSNRQFKVMAWFDCGEEGHAAYRAAYVSILQVELHPNALDFQTGKVGRVMISAMQDHTYYTTNITTITNSVAQTNDHKVSITAYLTPATLAAGQSVYFRVLDPDLVDKSSYATNNTPGDNRDPTIRAGQLSASSAVAQLCTINGKQVAAAEVELNFTDRYSGDNYLVQCSLWSNFSMICDTSVVMVAWKRIYIEEDNMYKNGATIISDFATDENTNDDVIIVDNTSDLSTNDNVVIFSTTLAVQRTVIAKTATSITVSDMDIAFPVYSGVRVYGSNDVYEAPGDYIGMTYGSQTLGQDGGSFRA